MGLQPPDHGRKRHPHQHQVDDRDHHPRGFRPLRVHAAIGLQNPGYRLQIWLHIDPVFVLLRDPKYDLRTPGMAAASALVVVRNSPFGLMKNKKEN
jgi:hypothetical protein